VLEMIKDAVRPSAWVAFVKGTVHGLGVRYRHASRKQKVRLGVHSTAKNGRADFTTCRHCSSKPIKTSSHGYQLKVNLVAHSSL
jgi:hypothetical protein